MVSYRDSGSAGQMCANNRGLNLGLPVKEQSPYSLHYTAMLAFFFSNVSPILDLQHWVIGSGHNPMACL